VVNGIRIAIAGVGPTPGIIPAIEPIRAPSMAIMRFVGVRALPKPAINRWIVSMPYALLADADHADGQRDVSRFMNK
jgi:hypothetical protein